MNKKVISILIFAVLGALVSGQAIYAANSILSVFPASGSKNAGESFDITVQIDPQGNKVCVVKGTLSLDNLTCGSIAVASGITAQTMPTCTSPSFILGIPRCAITAQNVLVVSVRGNKVGQAKASLTGFSVIGVGALVPSGLQGGTYNIIAASSLAPKLSPTPSPAISQIPVAASPVPLFDITSAPVAPKKPSVIPLIVFSAVLGILIILIVIFVIRRIRAYVIAKKIREDTKNKKI